MVRSRAFFADNMQPMAQILTMDTDSGIISSKYSSISMEFNNTLSYYIFFLDPISVFYSLSPNIMPTTMITLVKNHLLIYIKVYIHI